MIQVKKSPTADTRTCDVTPAEKPASPEPECDHQWQVVNESFDHEFGVEIIIYQRCDLCDAERDYDPPDYADGD